MFDKLIKVIANRQCTIGVVGLGYVGLPLTYSFCKENYKVLGFDIAQDRVDLLNQGKHYLKSHFTSEALQNFLKQDLFSATTDFSRIKEVDIIILCVPTPIDKHNVPDLSYVINSARICMQNSRPGQAISLESTTYPGNTEEVILPLVKEMNYELGENFFMLYSPEREDPSNPEFSTSQIPKVISGHTKNCLAIAKQIYEKITQVVPVSSIRAAEMTKILENSYRLINISFINEMKIICDKMQINIHEIIDAASTKPFGFHAWYPGPGIGGHCIPVDPFYLSYKAEEYGVSTNFIDLSFQMNERVKNFVVEKVFFALNNQKKSVADAKILLLGLAYKKNVADLRESPAIDIALKLQNLGAKISYHDHHIPDFDKFHYPDVNLEKSINLDTIGDYDLVLLLTNHDDFDYEFILKNAKYIIDTRGVYKKNKANNVFFA